MNTIIIQNTTASPNPNPFFRSEQPFSKLPPLGQTRRSKTKKETCGEEKSSSMDQLPIGDTQNPLSCSLAQPLVS